MNRLENLREIADESLAGLEAGPGLRNRILMAKDKPARRSVPRWVPAVSLALVLVIVLAGTNLPGRQTEYEGPRTTAIAAGSGGVANERASLRNGSRLTVVSQNAGSPHGIWAEGSGAFPMVTLNGRTYRRLTQHSADRSCLSNLIGEIQEFSREPSLSSSEALSNTVPVGTKMYAVSGMGSTLVGCEAEGQLILFQRVSFNGSALLGGESFRDVMQLEGHVVGMSLSGVGMVEGEEAARLFRILSSSASFESSGSVTASQLLLIELDNGCAVQMAVRNDRLAGCGVWNCPEFLDAFRAAVQ